ncbi:Bax inhibitor-1 family protein [Snodgrassella sp. CFCC 13594]|uniref:Bax inhibitor-1 family protein n=1 Tax=Snodgrassella sp. CFCC 13594 TaxID=1775559 RepID=UPI0008340998|nr:Bax inhibitor-1 family protein [Snodgrassella sp. CFCC 13594]
MQPQRDAYDYTQLGQQVDSHNAVLRKTYGLLGLSFIPCVAGAMVGMQTNFMNLFGNSWLSIIAFFAFFYGMCFAIEKNRYSNIGIALLMVFTFGLGFMLGPILQFALSSANGGKIVAMAAGMTAALFLVMATMAGRSKIDMSGLGRFLMVGGIVLMVGVVLNLFLKIPVVALAISTGFVIFSSLLIMWQIRAVIDGGENSPISAALTIFVSIYNIFSSLLHILLSLTGDDR